MALIQINEPIKSNSVERKIGHTKKKLAVGIDLGTTYCSVSQINEKGEVHFFEINGQSIIPSVAAYCKNKQFIGYEAIAKAYQKNLTLIHSVKRLIGIGLNQVSNPDFFSYPISANQQNNLINIHTEAGIKNPIEVSADLLANLKKIVYQELAETDGQKLLSAVITVPAYFDDSQRQATKDAGKIAGIKVLRIISEPTSAALAYGLDKKSEGIFAVYDLGGGTFDFSILQMQKDIFQVLATGGNSALGGNDFDQIIMKKILKQMNLLANKVNQTDLFKLWQISKAIKHKLSKQDKVQRKIKISNKEIDFELTRNEFQKLINPLISQTIKICQNAIKDSNLRIDEIEGVVLVGGSSRIPLISKMLKDTFKSKIYSNLNADTVVAQGAGLQADILSGGNNNALLLDVTPLSLGIEIMGELVEKIIHRNTPIPIHKSQFFTTFKDNQTAISIHILQGEREKVKDCRSLAKFSIKGLPLMKASAAKLEVNFQLDADGILLVSAFEHKSKKQAEIMVKPSYGLSEDEIEKMIISSFKNAKTDAVFRQKKSNLIKSKRLIEELESALRVDAKILSKKEKKDLLGDITELKKISELTHLSQSLKQKLLELTGQLSKKADQFAAKRLKNNLKNRRIKKE